MFARLALFCAALVVTVASAAEPKKPEELVVAAPRPQVMSAPETPVTVPSPPAPKLEVKLDVKLELPAPCAAAGSCVEATAAATP